MGATMEGMVEEKGILPERSEWFRSRRYMFRMASMLGLRTARRTEAVPGSTARALCRLCAGYEGVVDTESVVSVTRVFW